MSQSQAAAAGDPWWSFSNAKNWINGTYGTTTTIPTSYTINVTAGPHQYLYAPTVLFALVNSKTAKRAIVISQQELEIEPRLADDVMIYVYDDGSTRLVWVG